MFKLYILTLSTIFHQLNINKHWCYTCRCYVKCFMDTTILQCSYM